MRTIVRFALAILPVSVLAATAASAGKSDAPGLYDLLSERVAAVYDSARGGFVDRNGVPSESAVELALLRPNGKRSTWRAQGLRTIEWTRGLVDSAGGGYYHGSASVDPSNPAFEKRTDSNARRLENLLLAARVTGDASFRKEAGRVADFMVRVPFDARGGFAESQFGHGELVPEVNGIAAHGWLEWAAATRNPQRRDEALVTLDRMWKERWTDANGFLRAEPADPRAPLLVDQVEMGRAFVLAANIAGRDRDRARAALIGKLVMERFADPKKGGFRTKATMKKNGEIAGARAVSGENARAARFLCELAALTGDERYRHAAGRAWVRFAKEHDKPNLGAADWALAVRAAVDPVLTGAPKWEKLAANEEPAPPRVVRIGKVRK